LSRLSESPGLTWVEITMPETRAIVPAPPRSQGIQFLGQFEGKGIQSTPAVKLSQLCLSTPENHNFDLAVSAIDLGQWSAIGAWATIGLMLFVTSDESSESCDCQA
jgi:hypothetical protein